MRNKFQKFIFICFVTVSCSDDSTEKPSLSNLLVGSWDWIGTCGGVSGACTFASAKNTKIITFTDSTFEGDVGFRGLVNSRYTLSDKMVQGTNTSYFVQLENGDGWHVTVNRNVLAITFEEMGEQYARIK